MNRLKRISPVIVIAIFLFQGFFSCGGNTHSIYYDEPLELFLKKTEKSNKGVCIILANNRLAGEQYIETLRYGNPDIRAIFNVVDMSDANNKWYRKWLCPDGLPVACVFRDNKLTGLIAGFTYKGMQDLNRMLKDPSHGEKIFSQNIFDLTAEDAICVMNEALICKWQFEAGNDISGSIDKSIESVNYPFNRYLKIQNELRFDRPVDSLCREFRRFRNFYYLEIFKEEFFEIERLLNPEYLDSGTPELTIVSNSFSFDNCSFGEEYRFEVVIKNTGGFPLSILRVMTSCGCLKFEGYSNVILRPEETIKLPFIFKPDARGHIFREMSILSDDPQNPVTNVSIETDVD